MHALTVMVFEESANHRASERAERQPIGARAVYPVTAPGMIPCWSAAGC